MSNITVNKQGPEAMRDNPTPGARQEYVARSQEYRPTPAAPPDFRVVLAWGIVAGGFLLIVAIAYFLLWRLPVCWGVYTGPCRTARQVEPLAFAVVLASPLVGALVWLVLWVEHRRAQIQVTRGEAARAAITLDRWGNPVDPRMFLNLPMPQQVELYWRMLDLASKTKVATAPYETLPAGLNSYSPNNSSTTNAADQKLLEAPPDVGPLPPARWLEWLEQQPHAIFAAKTKSGKSTLARYALRPRLESGEDVFVIDPHSSGWFNLPGVGGGENWAEVESAMMTVYAEYKHRMDYREEYMRDTEQELDHYYFPRLTVIFDEAFLARFAFDRIYAGGQRRNNPWPLFAECLSSGARKTGISVWMLTQSALVEDLGLSGGLRENFTRIALDDYSMNKMVEKEEKKKERKEAIYAALPGMQYPATAIIGHEVYILDRTGINDVAPPRNARACAWAGWDYGKRVPLVTLGEEKEARRMPSVSASVREDGDLAVLRASLAIAPQTDKQTDAQTGAWPDAKKLAVLRQLRAAGLTRDQARGRLGRLGQGFDNDDWTKAGQA